MSPMMKNISGYHLYLSSVKLLKSKPSLSIIAYIESKSQIPLKISGHESPNAATLKFKLFYSKNVGKKILSLWFVMAPMIPNINPQEIKTVDEKYDINVFTVSKLFLS